MRKIFVSGAAVLALLMNSPQVSADDDIVIFGGEFEDEVTSPAPKKVAKPVSTKNSPSKEKPAPVEVATREPAAPASEHTVIRPRIENQKPSAPSNDVSDKNRVGEPVEVATREPAAPASEHTVIRPRIENQPSAPSNDVSDKNRVGEPVEVATREPAAPASEHTVIRPRIENQPSAPSNDVRDKNRVGETVEVATREPAAPASEHTVIRPRIENQPSAPSNEIGDKDRVSEPVEVNPPIETDQPFNPPTALPDEPFVEPVVVVPPPVQTIQEPLPQSNVQEPPVVTERPTPRRTSPQPQQELKVLKPRFIKLAVDDTYTYYLDKTSVKWKKMPYSSSEYIADVWVRMIERQPKSLEDDMASYGADNFNAEISLAREQGYQYAPEDLQVLRSQAYVLEHYYLRPKTEQIQFLCELEVFGRPQNTINERAYDYKNWESLVPGSVESVIYAATIKVIGKSKASERGHMTFFDMLDEYARIALN